MSKFKVRKSHGTTYYISDGDDHYMHSEGRILSTTEFWPTHEQAQAVLDKFRPKHVWVHGDVFRDTNRTPFICFTYYDGSLKAFCLRGSMIENHVEHIGVYIKDATFLFNIKDKL